MISRTSLPKVLAKTYVPLAESVRCIHYNNRSRNCMCCGLPSTQCFLSKSTKRYQSTVSDNKYLNKLLENNKKWVKETNDKDPTFFTNLGKGQAPKYLYFGCSDSRVHPNLALGLGPGELFVHRNIGNLVPGNDLSALSVVEYAVTHLGVTDIIVTGHYECGAVRAASGRQDLGTLENWLRLIRDTKRLHKDTLDAITDKEEHHKKFVELNVIEQCLNVYKTGPVQRKQLQIRDELLKKNDPSINVKEEIYPRIHGMVFNPHDGTIKTLDIDYDKRIGSLEHIYGLYDTTTK